MSLILRQVIGYQQGRKASALPADPELKRKLEQTKKDLAQILNKWNWGGVSPKTSQEFINKFEPWINQKIKEQKSLQEFLTRKGVNDLEEAETKLTNRDLSENEELEQVREELTQSRELWNNTEQDYLRRIEELQNRATSDLSEEEQEKLNNYEDLEADLDQTRRDKGELEQELLARGNQLRNKNQEVANKDKEITRLKKEHSEKEKALKKAQEDLKKKYSKQGKLLDEEQCENNKLTEKIESLERKITELGGTL